MAKNTKSRNTTAQAGGTFRAVSSGRWLSGSIAHKSAKTAAGSVLNQRPGKAKPHPDVKAANMTNRRITGFGSLANCGFEIRDDVDLTKPIAEQVFGNYSSS